MSQRITFIFLISCLLIFPVALQAQNINVRGKVTDQNGSPLPGVTIKVQGTNTGTSTDATGNFTIAAPSGAKLVITQLGMVPQTITVTSAGPVAISLTEDSQALGEVVVVGYGTQKKSLVTGSISSVKAKDLETMPINRIEQALQGRTSGLTIAANNGQPGSASTVRIRGFTSFARDGNNNPLWVVDGVIVDNGGIGYLNQSDIESIEVLKDAASQAIYGARAANGVILVTTKRGKAGVLQVNYNGFYGTSSAAKKLDLLNARDYAMIRNEASLNTNPGAAVPFANPSVLGDGTDWQSTIFNDDARRQTHEFSISGGGDKSTFYTSFGYIAQDGIVASEISKWNRANVRLNSTHKLAKWITLGQNLGYSHSVNSSLGNTNNEFGGPLSSAIGLDPTTPAVVTDPEVASKAPYTTPNAVKDANGNFYGLSPWVGQELINPLAYIQTRIGNYNWDHNIVGNAFAEIRPIADLTFRSTLGTKIAFWGDDAFNPVAYFNSSNNRTKNSFVRRWRNALNYNFENTLSYSKKFGEHNLTALIGQGFYLDENNKEMNVTYNNVIATNFKEANLNYLPLATDRSVDGRDFTVHKVNSLFSRISYDYAEKYLFTGIIRRDGSSRFGPDNKFGYYPSFSLGWVPSNESFWKDNKIVNFLKFRGGYGVTGNDQIDDFRYVALVNSGRNYTFGTGDASSIGWSPAAPSNPALKWEETRSTNIGFDATILTDFTLAFEVYKKKTVGILQYPFIPQYLGYAGAPAQNIGDMENSGLEIELGYRRKLGEVDFNLNGNLSFLKNKITKLDIGKTFIEDEAQSFQGMGNITRTGLGRSFNEFYGYETLGIFQTQAEVDSYLSPSGAKLQPNAKPGDVKFANLNGNDQIEAGDRTYLGTPLPKYTYGLTLNLGYKNFDFVAFGSGAGGNMIFQGLRRLDVTFANWQTDILNRWTPSNPSSTMPRVVEKDDNKNNTNFTRRYLEKGDYFRLKTLQIGYNIPKNIIQKVGAQKVRVYVMSENLFTITKYTGFDPEIGGTVFGIDKGIYPQARSFMIGLNVGF